jgi:hypothetical protein
MRRSISLAGVLTLAALAGCGHNDSMVEPGASLNCKGVSFNATIANVNGAATLKTVLVTSDGDPYTYTFLPTGGAPAASIGMTVTFRYATVGMHTVKVVVADQTVSPSGYRVSGDSSQLLMCTTAQSSGYSSGPIEPKTATLATGESISYDYMF